MKKNSGVIELSNNIDLKKHNKNRIFRFLYHNEPLSKQDIAYSLQMSLPTVSQNLKELSEQNLILEHGLFDSTGGRKAKALSFNRDATFSIGLDITKNHVGIVVVNLGGEVILHERLRKKFMNSEEYFKELGALIGNRVSSLKIDPEKIYGVGIAVPGIISKDMKNVVYSPVLGFTGGTLDCFSQSIPYRCTLCNDANAAGFAELWKSNSASNVVYLSLSDSVGGSILIDNKIYAGENERSGEFGHMTIVPNGRLCYCGQKGCVDAYCSAHILSDSADGNLSKFFDLVRAGSEPHKAIWQEYLYYLSIAINNLRMLFDCKVIVGGYVGSYMDQYIDSLKNIVEQRNTFEKDSSYVEVCQYKLESIAVGAALMHIDQFINGI